MPLLAPAAETPRYFPAPDDSDLSILHADLQNGTADMLARFAEPTLCCSATPRLRGYRFTWLRSFDNPVVIRIDERTDGGWDVVVKMADRRTWSGSRKLKLIRDKKRAMDVAAIQPLLADFAPDAEFWRLPTWNDDLGLDGATWLIEAHSNGRYHHVSRWSPKSGLIREMGLRFLSAAQLKVERVY